MTTTSNGTARGTVRSDLLSWAVLLIGAAIAGILYSSADSTSREARRAVGNGIGTYTSVSTSRSGVMTVAALLVLSAGLIVWAVIWSRKQGPVRWLPALVATVVIVAAAWIVIEPFTEGDGWADFERYPNATALTEAMRDEGDECIATFAPPGAERRGLYRERLVCRLPSLADIRDGHDDVAIDFFVDDSARDIWTESVDHEDSFAVIGPDWAITCEFQSTCAHLQSTIGGRNY
jgi:hypothetical protein